MQTLQLRKRLIHQMAGQPGAWHERSALKCAAGLLVVALMSLVGAYGANPIHEVTEAQQTATRLTLAYRNRHEFSITRKARFELAHDGEKFDPIKP